jgi:phosphate transport system permease protein
MLFTASIKGFQLGSAAAKDAIVNSLVAFGAIVTVIPIASILFTVVQKGLPGISLNLFISDMSMATPTDPLSNGGILHAITGTLALVALALVMSVPIGILTALYLTEIKGRFTAPIRFLVQAMSGVPSIVAGLFILSAILYPITKSFSGFMGALALTILMIPTIARTSEEVLKIVPEDLRSASYALGASQARTTFRVVLPTVASGLVTASVLGVARVVGETAPLLLTASFFVGTSTSITEPIASLPVYIFTGLTLGDANSTTRSWGGSLVLLVMVLILFLLARFASSRLTRKR